MDIDYLWIDFLFNSIVSTSRSTPLIYRSSSRPEFRGHQAVLTTRHISWLVMRFLGTIQWIGIRSGLQT